MTEESTNYLTPIFICSSNETDHLSLVSKLRTDRYGDTPSEQVSLIQSQTAKIGIEIIRNLIQELSYVSYQGKIRHIIILGIDSATIEAQNAMLKLLEEPPAKTQIWLTAQHTNTILPTVLSRCEEVSVEYKKNTQPIVSEKIVDLAHLSYREISELADKHSDRAEALQLVQQLVLDCHQQLEKSDFEYIKIMTLLLKAQQHLQANVNTRLALEACLFSIKKVLKK